MVVFSYWSQGRGHTDKKKRMATLGKLGNPLPTRIIATIIILSIVSIGIQVSLVAAALGNWSSMTSGTTVELKGVWGSSGSDVFAVGKTGTILHYDVGAPTVTSFNPADDATGVAVNANLVITFSENVVAGTGNIVIYKSDDTVFETIAVGDAKVSIANNVVTINPAGTFASQTGYYVQIAATCFDDTSGNSYAGISDKTTWNFTSADVGAPTVTSFNPADDATGVAVSTTVSVTFSEAMDSSTITTDSFTLAGSAISGTVSYDGATYTATFTPDANLEYNHEYTATLSTDIKDVAGNPIAGYTWSFTTQSAPDTTPPTGSISINNDATYTDSRSVTLTLSASDNLSGVSQMMITNSSSFEGASWESYATSKSWTLTSGDGRKKVYTKFKDGAGNISEIYSDDIILDTTPPTVTITSPSADTSVRSEVVIKGTASDENFLEYKVEYGQGTEPSSWTEITSSTSQVTDDTLATWDTSSLNDGSYTLRLTAADLASNSAQTQVSLRVDNHPPEVTLIDYPSDTVTGNTPKVDVTFTWEGSDPDDITLAEDLVYQQKLVGHPDYSEWSDWSSETSKTYMLSSGNYTFNVRAKDKAGNYPEEDDPATAKSSFTVSIPIIIYPNPCYPNQGQIVTIVNLSLSSDVRIYIYDLGGNLIRTLGESEANIQGGSKLAIWDCRNDNGEIVARGIYIYFIPSATEKKTGKIAIIK